MNMKRCAWCDKPIPGTIDRPWQPGDSIKISHDECRKAAYQKWVKE